jgi:hypothetical protein
MFDSDGNGYISPKEIGMVMRQVDIDMTDHEIDEVIERIDKNNDGKIGFDGKFFPTRNPIFVSICQQQNMSNSSRVCEFIGKESNGAASERRDRGGFQVL